MACRESRGSKIVLCLTLLVVFGSLCHCARLTTLKALDKLRGNSTHVMSQSEGRDVRHGRLLIGKNSMQDNELGGSKKDTFNTNDHHLHCTQHLMVKMLKKNVCFINCSGNGLSPLPLSKLPPSCGYTIQSTRRDLVFVAPYDGCFVALEDDCYVLPLRWSGLPVRMSCPLRQSSPNPPMVACHPQGMVVRTGWTVSVAKINVNCKCWPLFIQLFFVLNNDRSSVNHLPFVFQNGMYTLDLAGEQEIRISCPSLLPPQNEQTSSDGGRELRTETPSHQAYPSPPFLLTYTQSNAPQVTGSAEQPSAKPPVIQQPTGQLLYPYPFYVKTPYAPEGTTPRISSTMSPTIPTPENKVPLEPNTTPSPIEQPLYPFYPPTAAPWLPQTDAPRGPVEQPFYPFDLPTAGPWSSQPEAPPSLLERPLYPFHPNPTTVPRPSQAEAPPSPTEQSLYPFYLPADAPCLHSLMPLLVQQSSPSIPSICQLMLHGLHSLMPLLVQHSGPSIPSI
uniref:Uncharacterized protein n=1 Tax=Gasterosteus aculeatus aculeatus TaxID=481459 RepID=A0AAQ4QW76_GASAC